MIPAAFWCPIVASWSDFRDGDCNTQNNRHDNATWVHTKTVSVIQAWPGLGCLFRYTAAVPSARLGINDTSSSVPRHYLGTLSPAGSQRSQQNVRVSLRRSRLFDLKPKTIMWWKRRRARERDTLLRVVSFELKTRLLNNANCTVLLLFWFLFNNIVSTELRQVRPSFSKVNI